MISLKCYCAQTVIRISPFYLLGMRLDAYFVSFWWSLAIISKSSCRFSRFFVASTCFSFGRLTFSPYLLCRQRSLTDNCIETFLLLLLKLLRCFFRLHRVFYCCCKRSRRISLFMRCLSQPLFKFNNSSLYTFAEEFATSLNIRSLYAFIDELIHQVVLVTCSIFAYSHSLGFEKLNFLFFLQGGWR